MAEIQRRSDGGSVKVTQRQNLMKLRHIRPYSLRELAKRSTELAERRGDPKLEFTHQAISKWFRGISTPSSMGRELLATVYDISKNDIDLHCGIQPLQEEVAAVPIIVNVTDTLGMRHEYKIGARPEIDLSRSHIFRDWSSLLSERPGCINRHLRSFSDRLCGYTPLSIPPYINHSKAVVLLETGQKAFDRVESPEKKLWFAYLPDGSLELSYIFLDQQGRHVIVARPGERPSKWRTYHKDQIDRVGYVGDRVLFHLSLAQEISESVSNSIDSNLTIKDERICRTRNPYLNTPDVIRW